MNKLKEFFNIVKSLGSKSKIWIATIGLVLLVSLISLPLVFNGEDNVKNDSDFNKNEIVVKDEKEKEKVIKKVEENKEIEKEIEKKNNKKVVKKDIEEKTIPVEKEDKVVVKVENTDSKDTYKKEPSKEKQPVSKEPEKVIIKAPVKKEEKKEIVKEETKPEPKKEEKEEPVVEEEPVVVEPAPEPEPEPEPEPKPEPTNPSFDNIKNVYESNGYVVEGDINSFFAKKNGRVVHAYSNGTFTLADLTGSTFSVASKVMTNLGIPLSYNQINSYLGKFITEENNYNVINQSGVQISYSTNKIWVKW
ncbi:hypothetical protein [Virgibacillus sp. DJP39]|uniref:hypothetical protein n=1 Tax=Virgibacillus sp. DJP39 TaxID=3409790 RepID=UPI003BB7C1D3